MKNKWLITAISASLILTSALTACSDTEADTTTPDTTQDITTESAAATDKATEAVTDAPVTNTPATDAPAEDTQAPETDPPATKPVETNAPETKPPVTTSPETTAPVDTQPIADPEQFPDDWGKSYENNAFRTDRKEFLYWTKTRHLVEIPKNFPTNWVVEMIDEKNEQIFISVGELSEGTCVFYALVNGVFYKLSEEKIISVTIHNKKFAWIEEDGTVYSINLRSKWFNEVYLEASGVAGMFFRNNELLIANQEGELIERNEEDILRDVKKVSN